MHKKPLTRVLSVLLSCALVFSLAPWALADGEEGGDGGDSGTHESQEVTAPSKDPGGNDEKPDPPEEPSVKPSTEPTDPVEPTGPVDPSAEPSVSPSTDPTDPGTSPKPTETVKPTDSPNPTNSPKPTTSPKPSVSFSLNRSSLSLDTGDTSTLTVSVAPTGTSFTAAWSTSDSSVVSISSTSGATITITAKKAGTATITVKPKSGGKTYSDLTCTVKVTSKGAATINYKCGSEEDLTFTASDFNTVCKNYTGYALDYVKFSLPSSSKGVLYYNYDGGDYDSKVDKSTKYYYSGSSRDLTLGKVAFVPESGTSGTVNISYTGWNTKGISFTGTVAVAVSKDAGTVSYEAAAGEVLVFDSDDFNSLCKKLTGKTLDYVRFDLPTSSKGVLYYNYDDGDYDKKVSASTSYYYDDTPALDKVAFVVGKDASGTINISFTGRATNRSEFTGTVKVTVDKSSRTVSYSTAAGTPVTLDGSDFNKVCKAETGKALDYVKFTLPAASKGVLYLDYNTSSSKAVSKSTSYYYDDTPKLDHITFVPAASTRGTVNIDFTARDTNNKSFSGTLRITVGGSKGDVPYTALAGQEIAFKASDFNAFCKDETGSNMDYVKFTLPDSSKGTLYYKYDEDGEKKVTANTQYSRSGSPSLDDVSFVPKGSSTGSITLQFSGKSTNDKSFSGTVLLTYTAAKAPEAVRYSTGVEPVAFSSTDFIAVCQARGGAGLASIQFTALPQRKAGKLYVNYGGPASFGGHVNTGTAYTPAGGNPISNISFVPRAGFKGTLTIPYTGTDSAGTTFTGSIEITVTPPDHSSHFRDTEKFSWAVPSVDYLYENKISTGVSDTDYGPDRRITRRDFVVMLVRAFNLKGGTGDNFQDVPEGTYYYDALATAKALGIAQGNGGRFQPDDALTRQDAMLLLQRTLQVAGRTVESDGSGGLNRFGDADAVAEYAEAAVDLLVQAGVIQGDESGHINPTNSLTRAEMAVILHRVLTM